jgi:predicted negative regulator of RcsB-dependent stress response
MCNSKEDRTHAPPLTEIKAMNRGNMFFLVIGALVVIASVLGYQLYQDRKQPKGVEILLGPKGVSIENK